MNERDLLRIFSGSVLSFSQRHEQTADGYRHFRALVTAMAQEIHTACVECDKQDADAREARAKRRYPEALG